MKRTENENGFDMGPLLELVGFFLIASLFFILVSCGNTRRLPEKTDSKDSVRVETVVRRELVTDTVYVEIPKEIVRQTVRDTSSRLETEYALSDARINTDGTLFHSLENKAGKRPETVKKEVVYKDSIAYRDRTVVKTETVEVERELTWWQKTRMKGFWVLLVVLAVVFRKELLSVVRRVI